MARRSGQFKGEKRRKELKRQKKQEEKRLKRMKTSENTGVQQLPDDGNKPDGDVS